MKKPKKEPIEDKEDIIGEKKDLDKLYQAMKYQAKKRKPSSTGEVQQSDLQTRETRFLAEVPGQQEV